MFSPGKNSSTMPRRKKQNYFNELFALGVIFVIIGSLSSESKDSAGQLGALAPLIQIAVSLAGFVLCVGLFLKTRSWIKSQQQTQPQRLDLVATGQPSNAEIASAVDSLDWFQLEQLVAALFRAKGNRVETRGGANADGGIDLVVDSGSSTAAVQCKHWSKWKCGPGVVRELIGSMKHESITQGFLVCRTATGAAFDLAAKERITIVDRNGLVDRIDSAIDADNEEVRRLLFAPDKLCPKCGAQMVRRTAAKGSNAGSEFWGCSKYPSCRQTMRV
jgi:HJR/Mrr/RecB family endonuclease